MEQVIPAEECTHLAIPKDRAQLIFDYLGKQSFESVANLMSPVGVMLVKLNVPSLKPVEASEPQQ